MQRLRSFRQLKQLLKEDAQRLGDLLTCTAEKVGPNATPSLNHAAVRQLLAGTLAPRLFSSLASRGARLPVRGPAARLLTRESKQVGVRLCALVPSSL